ncbi:MAG: 2Fe-2S iron-sulfur cluster-binding protein, partial [Phycisphaerales bacterium]|nr:2Fe-2S iron-sulfur cluster-binding protein [Phycisphaerales bacterium]
MTTRSITTETPESSPRELLVRGESSLSEFLRSHGIPLNTRCSGRGLCDSCTVELVDPSAPGSAGGSIAVKSCTTKLSELPEAVHIRIPARSYLKYTPQIVTDYRVNIPCGHDPLCKGPGVGVAVDVGTTTVAVLLVNLADGKVLAQASMFNQQMNLGDDVVTRIDLCARDKAMIGKLRNALIRETLVPLVAEALPQALRGSVVADQVRCFSIAGNTVMQHLVAGVDPTPLGTAPFTPAFLTHKVIGVEEFPDAAVHLLPSAAAYVGA